MDTADKWLDWYNYEYLEKPRPKKDVPRPKCPGCKQRTKFKFHYNTDDGFPNECLSCGIFCNYKGEIKK